MVVLHSGRLTGPNGKYFCNDCLVTQQDVAKGIPHSPVILPRYLDSDLTQGKRVPVRDLESIAENANHSRTMVQKSIFLFQL